MIRDNGECGHTQINCVPEEKRRRNGTKVIDSKGSSFALLKKYVEKSQHVPKNQCKGNHSKM